MSHLLDSVPFKQGPHLQILSQSPASPWRWGTFWVLKNCTSGIKALIFTPKEFGVVTEDLPPSLVGVAPDFSEDYPSRHNSISLVWVRVFPFAGRASASPFQDRIIVCFLGLIKWKTISFEFSFLLINTFNCFFLCLFIIIGSYLCINCLVLSQMQTCCVVENEEISGTKLAFISETHQLSRSADYLGEV